MAIIKHKCIEILILSSFSLITKPFTKVEEKERSEGTKSSERSHQGFGSNNSTSDSFHGQLNSSQLQASFKKRASSASDAATTASLSQVDAASGCSTKDTNSSPCSWIAHMMEAQNKWKGMSVSLEYLQEPKEEFKVTTCNWEREGNSVFSEFGQVLQHDQSSNSRASVEADEESGGGGGGGDHINNSFYNSHGDLVANLKSPASACSQTHAAGNRSIINGDHHHLFMTENLAVSYH